MDQILTHSPISNTALVLFCPLSFIKGSYKSTRLFAILNLESSGNLLYTADKHDGTIYAIELVGKVTNGVNRGRAMTRGIGASSNHFLSTVRVLAAVILRPRFKLLPFIYHPN